MAYKFRTSGPWGPGQSQDLDPVDVDNNFWQAIQDIAAKAAQGVGISNITQNGNQLTVVLTDHTLLGPFPLPLPTFKFQGEWQPNFNYLAADIITHGGATYMVGVAHLSAATFDPGATDGQGHDLYDLLLENPAITVPTGGATGAFLRKLSGADLDMTWTGAAIVDLDDVLLNSPTEGDVLTYSSGVWTNVALPAQVIPTLNALTDVQQSPAVAIGQTLKWNGSLWTFVSAGATSVATLSDVALATIGSPISNQPLTDHDVLTYNAALNQWVNYPQQGHNQISAAYTLSAVDNTTYIDGNSGPYNITTPASTDPIFNFYCFIRQPHNSSGLLTIVAGSGITLQVPTGKLAKTRGPGSIICVARRTSNQWVVYGDLANAAVALINNSSPVSIDPASEDTTVYTLNVTNTQTFNAASAPIGKRIYIVMTTSTTTSFTFTFGTNFKSAGTISTGTVSGKVFVIGFVGDGTNMNEVSRSGPL